jgi:hypothetical protein
MLPPICHLIIYVVLPTAWCSRRAITEHAHDHAINLFIDYLSTKLTQLLIPIGVTVVKLVIIKPQQQRLSKERSMIRNQRYDLSLRNKGLAALLYYVKKDEQPPNYAHLLRDQAPLGVANPAFF